MEKLWQETKTAAVQNPKYQKTRDLLLTSRKQEDEPYFQGYLTFVQNDIHGMKQNVQVLNIPNSAIWDQIRKRRRRVINIWNNRKV